MPDWSYHPLKSLILDKISPQSSREFLLKSMSTIALLPLGRNLIGFLGHMNPPQAIQKEINDTKFPSLVGLSGQIDPHLSGVSVFQELGFGFLEIGPIVLREPKIQRGPRKENGRIHFSTQQEKVPLKLAIKNVTSRDIGIPLFARIDTKVNRSEFELIVQHLSPFVDGFVITNEQLNSYIENESHRLDHTVYVSFSTNDINEKKVEIAQLKRHPCVGGIVINAPRQIKDAFWYEAENANECLVKMVKQVKELYPELFVITSGGVETPDDAYALVRVGTNLIMLTDGYVKAGPGLPKRIHERLSYEETRPSSTQNWSWSFLFGLSILIGGIIALYFACTSIILPYDEEFIGLTKADLSQINPLILSFMSHDRMALAGTMISGGILYIQLARHGIKNNMHWARITFHAAAIIGFLGIFLFIGFGYFDWLHGLFWLILFPIYYLSYKEGNKVTGTPISSHGKNDHVWKYSLYGQLMFIILGIFIIVGGIIISTIGVSKVFVTTDLSYLCMSPGMLDEISNNLVPVIAHDRAGFGSALVSVGLLVLMLSLWGFRKGESWVWNTLAVGALPALIAGIGTHIYIGYTTFVHLLPVYFLVILYFLGLLLSYSFLKRT